MDNKLKNIIDFCQEYDMLPKCGTVLACVSGGADSMCLLHILSGLSKKFDFSLAAAHYNHNLRGDESDGDERFVRQWCEKLCVPIYVGSGDVLAEAQKCGRGVEDMAREMRYGFFYETAGKTGALKIATAHTADDNLETVLLRIARGTGLLGLGGIPPVRGNIIRPILCLSRSDVESYNEENAIPHREDSSNESDDYARNRIRHHVIPVLKKLNPDVSSACADMTSLLRRDEAFIASAADDFLSGNLHEGTISADALLKLPLPVASRAIRLICGRGLSYEHVMSVLRLASSDDPSACVSIPGMTVRRQYDKIVFGDAGALSFEPVVLPVGGQVFLSELGIKISAEEIKNIDGVYKSLTTFLFNCDNICGNILVRPRKVGDSIRLSNKTGTKSLKKLFIDKKIPAHSRGAVPIICDDNGPVAIPGIGCDVRVIPSTGDSVIKVKVEEITNQ